MYGAAAFEGRNGEMVLALDPIRLSVIANSAGTKLGGRVEDGKAQSLDEIFVSNSLVVSPLN